MTRKYFGTDGIRGRANGVITPELALRVGQAAGLLFQRGDHRHRVVIGKDTRLSGYMIEIGAGRPASPRSAWTCCCSARCRRPAVAMLTRSMRADLGVMISASHNPFEDNGIKLFGPDGFKLSDDVEREIEALIDAEISAQLARSAQLGRAKRIESVHARYIEFAKRTLPRALDLEGMRVVVDCANGAAYKVAPEALWELGAEVVAIGVEPDGFNINRDVGSTAPEALIRQGARAARRHRHRARRRRRPGADRRREGPGRRRRPAHGGGRALLERGRPPVAAGRRRDRHVEPRPRALPRPASG